MDLQRLEEGVISVDGFRATGVSCGLKTGGSKDISLLISDYPCQTAMAFTKNKIQGAHIVVDKERINKPCRAILINSGNANCLTGQQGIDDANFMINTTAELLKISEDACLLASTGTIGVPLNMTRVKYGIERLANVIYNENNIRNFCSGISTSDTRHKNLGYRFKLGDDYVSIGMTAKGESMVKPWLETMQGTLLAVVTTDVNMSQSLLQKALTQGINNSLNRMSIDNDISPNDSVFLLANGKANSVVIDSEQDPRFQQFVDVLQKLMLDVTKLLLKQGLGTTKLIHIIAQNTSTLEVAEKVVRSVAESLQTKSGFFSSKIPWQKIVNVLSAYIDEFDLEKFTLLINDAPIFCQGQPKIAKIASLSMETSTLELKIVLDLGVGECSTDLWTCDLTHDYLKFNALSMDSL